MQVDNLISTCVASSFEISQVVCRASGPRTTERRHGSKANRSLSLSPRDTIDSSVTKHAKIEAVVF